MFEEKKVTKKKKSKLFPTSGRVEFCWGGFVLLFETEIGYGYHRIWVRDMKRIIKKWSRWILELRYGEDVSCEENQLSADKQFSSSIESQK